MWNIKVKFLLVYGHLWMTENPYLCLTTIPTRKLLMQQAKLYLIICAVYQSAWLAQQCLMIESVHRQCAWWEESCIDPQNWKIIPESHSNRFISSYKHWGFCDPKNTNTFQPSRLNIFQPSRLWWKRKSSTMFGERFKRLYIIICAVVPTV